jgi:hypothetical protein
MNQTSLTLLRTVFLPMGSPPIGSIYDIHTDISKADIQIEDGHLYCMGEIDILIDYLSFTPDAGKQLFSHNKQYSYPEGSGKEWQALLNLPFVLSQNTHLPPSKTYETAVKSVKWFMVAPRALEMEIEMIIGENVFDEPEIPRGIKDQKKDGGLNMVSIKDECSSPTTLDAEKERLSVEKVASDYIPPGMAKAIEYVAETDQSPAMADTIPVAASEQAEEEAVPVSVTEQTEVNYDEEKAQPVMVSIEDVQTAEEEEAVPVIADLEAEMVEVALDEKEPEIVKIVFNDETPVNDDIIKAAIHKAKEEISAAAAAVEEEEIVQVIAKEPLPTPVVQVRKTRIHGLPQFKIGATDDDEKPQVFNINIKMP